MCRNAELPAPSTGIERSASHGRLELRLGGWGKWLLDAIGGRVEPAVFCYEDVAVDGELRTGQHFVSRRFVHENLELGFQEHQFITWLPRIRGITLFVTLFEIVNAMHSVVCQCGLRVGVYTGVTELFLLAFPTIAFAFVTVLVRSSVFSSRNSAAMLSLVIVVLALLIVAGASHLSQTAHTNE